MNKKELTKHIIDKDLQITLHKLLDLLENCINFNKIMYSTFLTPTVVENILIIIKNNNFKINYSVFGGYDDAERCVIAFAPEYFEIKNQDFLIFPIKVAYTNKFITKLEHSDYLGGILGLSIKREYIGDILVKDNYAIIFVHKKQGMFILENLNTVGRSNVLVTKYLDDDFYSVEKVLEYVSVPSLRLDNLISKVYKISRLDTEKLINSKKVFINWVVVQKKDKIIKEDDIISVRGFGRVKFLATESVSKKENIRIKILKF